MKKILMSVLIVAFSVHIQGQTFDKLVRDYLKAEKTECVNIGKVGWNFVKLASIGNKDLAIINKISSVQVMDMSECSQEIKKRFASDVENLNDNEYELMLRTKDDEGETLILSKMEKDKIRELIILDKCDPAIVRLKGKFSLDDIASAASLKYSEI